MKARKLVVRKSVDGEFTVGDVIDPQGKTNMKGVVTIRKIEGYILFFTDSKGVRKNETI